MIHFLKLCQLSKLFCIGILKKYALVGKNCTNSVTGKFKLYLNYVPKLEECIGPFEAKSVLNAREALQNHIMLESIFLALNSHLCLN